MRYLIALLALFSISAAPSCWRNGWIEAGGDGGNVQGIGRAAAFAPFVHGPRSVGFVYGRAVIEGNRNYEGDLGAGFRALAGCATMGMYGFYDVQRTHRRHLFQEVTVGADLYLPNWEARINGYIPVFGLNNHGIQQSIVIENETPILLETVQGSLYGLNAEMGPHCCFWGKKCGCPEFRVLFGGYYFRRSGTASYRGYRARVEGSINPFPKWLRAFRVTLGAVFQKDRIQAGSWFLYARVSIPFGTLCRSQQCCDPCSCDPCSYLYHRIDRMDMVAIDRKSVGPTEILFKGRPVEQIITVGASTPNVPAAAAAAGQNSLVIVDGSVMLGTSITQPTGQTIAGGGTALPVTVPGSDLPVLAQLSGAPGELTNGAVLTLVNMSQNGTLFGLGLRGDAPATGLVQINNASDAMVIDSVVDVTSGTTAIDIVTSDRASVMESSFALASTNGIVLTGGSDHVIADSLFMGTASNVIIGSNTIGTAIETNQITTTMANAVGISLQSPGLANVEKGYRVIGNRVTAPDAVVFNGFVDGSVERNALIASDTGLQVTGISGAPGARVSIERNRAPMASTGLAVAQTAVDVNDNTINGATLTMDTANSTLQGSGNTAMPFSCMATGTNSGSVSFNNGTDTCP